jgi:hypothetical protein
MKVGSSKVMTEILQGEKFKETLLEIGITV